MKRNIIKTLLLIVLLLLAVVLGKVLGTATSGVAFLAWLGQGSQFGFAPVTIDLAVVSFTFGMMASLNVAQAILLLVAIFVYTRIHIKD